MVLQIHGDFNIPFWLIVLCSSAMTLGTAIGGYKTIKTVGMKMAKLEPYQGTASDISGAICLFCASLVGIPVSSSQTKTTAIMGVGASKRLSNVNWKLAKNMILAWVITFPTCIVLGYMTTEIFLKIGNYF